ncbi:MAG: PEP-CTERM sorting domain-containing protein [Planctomycetota bacterium]
MVDTEAAPGVVSYSYTLTVDEVPAGGISHINVETSANFTSDDLLDTDWPAGNLQVGLLTVNDGSHDMPSDMTGIKFDNCPDINTINIDFTSTRMPVWGDFYAKGGDGNAVWNAGFGTAAQESDIFDAHFDPPVGPSNGSINDHLLVPDSTEPPPPGAILRVFVYEDSDGDCQVDSDLANLLTGWAITLDGTTTLYTQSGANFGYISNGNHSIEETLQGGWQVTGALVFDAGTSWLIDTILAQTLINVNLTGDMDIYFGNIPEPATLTLLLLGGVGVVLKRRR